MRRIPVAIACCVALLAAAVGPVAAAGAATTPLNWTEKLVKGKATRLTFRFGTLQTTDKSWTATVEISNTGTGTVLLKRSQYGIVEFGTKTEFTHPVRVLPASSIVPAPPASLAPGKTWKGTMGGPGRPNERLYVRLVVGPFSTPAAPTQFTWITDHARHVFTISI